jgi:hypothetical protein
MLGDPLGKIRLRVHNALPQRKLRAKLDTLLLASVRVRQRTNRDDDRYQLHDVTPADGTEFTSWFTEKGSDAMERPRR